MTSCYSCLIKEKSHNVPNFVLAYFVKWDIKLHHSDNCNNGMGLIQINLFCQLQTPVYIKDKS